MLKSWFTQGVLTNVVSALIIGGGGVIVTLLAQRASAWAIPAMYGLATSTLLSIITACVRLGLFKSPRRTITPSNAKSAVREWLDNANVPVQNSPVDGWPFNYIATIDGRKIAIGQEGQRRAYLVISTSLTFTEEDNRAFESAPEGIGPVIKALKIALAISKTVYAGIEIPLRRIIISKRPFIGDGFLEHELHEAILEVECAFNIAAEIAAIPVIPVPKPKQTSQ
jgi:hypothetical protein